MRDHWAARLSCPQCGGGVELDAGDPIFSCPFCRTDLYLVSTGPLRYRLPPAPGETGASPLVYLPFWRFRGLRYRVLGEPPQVEGRLLDATVPAMAAVPAAANLGARPQVAPLAVDLGASGSPLPDRPVAAALGQAESAVESLHRDRALFTRLIGESVYLLLAPFTLERCSGGWVLREALRDGASYPLSEAQARAVQTAGVETGSRPERVSFLPLRCPECGHGLPGAPGAASLLCGRCTRAWWVRGGRFAPMPYTARRAGSRGVRYFPFWELTFRAEGLAARSRAELRRWVVPYQPAPDGWDRQPCLVLVPGFKLQPRTFLRMARIFSLTPLAVPSEECLFGEPFEAEPVRLPLAEASQVLKVLLAELSCRYPREYARAAGFKPRVKRARLVYLPFHRRGAEWVEEHSGMALQAAAVDQGSRL